MMDIAGGKEATVVRALEEDIIFGRLPPGTRLVEDALLARFPVTRHVVRAALAIPLPAPPALIGRLLDIEIELEGHVARGHLRGVHECNDRFHLTLFGACGNAYLVGSIEHYMRLSLPIRAKTLADPENLEVSRRHHRLMIELLKGRDNWALAQLCIDHLQPSKLDYLDRAGQDSDAA
ncbi:MAG: GntR family transcriptional regulator [Inquilinus limosus]|uniref:GntR family transcriptional regulator n=1 Tax=Inquilinus limosus TaxID=171674 RepID=A0A952KK79_9PROT|nr:GntR family transcriptional regulator [Inquilinus limosus]